MKTDSFSAEVKGAQSVWRGDQWSTPTAMPMVVMISEVDRRGKPSSLLAWVGGCGCGKHIPSWDCADKHQRLENNPGTYSQVPLKPHVCIHAPRKYERVQKKLKAREHLKMASTLNFSPSHTQIYRQRMKTLLLVEHNFCIKIGYSPTYA